MTAREITITLYEYAPDKDVELFEAILGLIYESERFEGVAADVGLTYAPDYDAIAAEALETWADKTEAHYPPDIFTPMDSAAHDAANAVLGKNGLPTRDRISADVMRLACKIAREDAASLRKGGSNA